MADTFFDPSSWTRETGQLAILEGKPVLWAGPYYGWQSPESYYSTVTPKYFEGKTGAKTPEELFAKASSLAGFDPDKNRPAAPSTTLPPTTAPYSGTTIPQQQDKTVEDLVKYLKELGDPERLRQVEEMRLQNLLKSQIVTSELTRQGERARYARDIEKANIDAWKERQIAMYNANAATVTGLGAATVAAFAPPSASALSSTLSAAMQPFSNIGVRKG